MKYVSGRAKEQLGLSAVLIRPDGFVAWASDLVGGLLIATLQYTEYRFVVIEHSVELYGALVAILFAAFGIWLGLRITRSRETIRETVVVKEVLVPAEALAPEPFAPNTARQQTLGITARELEILTLVARGFSNREIATQLFVSENTSRHTVPAPSTSWEPPAAPRPSSAAKN
jgi:NarL family two-component system response regulator LiaR